MPSRTHQTEQTYIKHYLTIQDQSYTGEIRFKPHSVLKTTFSIVFLFVCAVVFYLVVVRLC